MRPTSYQTRQEKALRQCLASLRGRHATVCDLRDALAARGERVGRTTVYRRLERLVSAGLARKFVAGPGEPACFAWAGEGAAAEGGYHALCEGCGKVVHLECGELDAVGRHLAAEHRFRIDPGRTVLYGTCPSCQRRGRRKGGVK